MNQVYSKLLSTKGHGYPLYIPEPNENLPYEYRQRGISIGDVGIITSDGGFDFLFNVCLPATDPINNDNVPEGFVPLVLERRDIFTQSYRHSPGAIISSARDFNSGLTVELSKGLLPFGAGFSLEFKTEEGALLYLPMGALRERLLSVNAFKVIAETHGYQWHCFARGRGRCASRSLIIVTGCDKTSMFAMSMFSGASRSAGISATVSATGLVDGNVSWGFSSTNYRSFDTRIGPTPPSSTRNQCVFLSFLQVPDKSLLKRFGRQPNMLPRQISSSFRGSTSIGEGEPASPPPLSVENSTSSQLGTGSSNHSDSGSNGAQTETCVFTPQLDGNLSTVDEAAPSIEPLWPSKPAFVSLPTNDNSYDRTIGRRADILYDNLEDRAGKHIRIVVKVHRAVPYDDDGSRRKFRQSIEDQPLVWCALKHPNIVGFLRSNCDVPSPAAIILPYFPDGNTLEYAKKNSTADVLQLLHGVRALEYLHQESPPIIHADIRACNVLIDNGNPRLVDCGLVPVLSNTAFTTANVVGPARWQAPEVFATEDEDQLPFTLKTDKFSFAMFAIELIIKDRPFDYHKSDIVVIDTAKNKRPHKPAVKLLLLLEKCWAEAPDGWPDDTCHD